MKLEIDTTDKTVTFEDSVKIEELIDTLVKMFPDEWKEYSIKPFVKVVSYPIYYYYPVYNYNNTPYWQTAPSASAVITNPPITGGTTTSEFKTGFN